MTTMEEVQNLLYYTNLAAAFRQNMADLSERLQQTQQKLIDAGLQLPLEVEYYHTGERYRISDGTSHVHDITNAVIDMRAGHSMSIAPNWKVEKVG